MTSPRPLRSRSFVVLACLGLAGTLACHPSADTQAPKEDGERSSRRDKMDELGEPGEIVRFAPHGVPHTSTISGITLDPTGEAALTLDAAGGLRFWSALDGSAEPLVVPIRDPRGMALIRAGEGWTLALLDAAGGVRIVSVDADGSMRPRSSLAPTDPLRSIVLVPGSAGEGEASTPARLVAIGADHILRVHDLDGKELGRVEEEGLRLDNLRVTVDAEGVARVFALTTGVFNAAEGRFGTQIIAVDVSAKAPQLGKQRREVFVDSPPVRDNPSLSPDGRTAVLVQRQRSGTGAWKVLATQLDDGRTLAIDSGMLNGAQPRVTVLPRGRVLLDDGTGMGRLADLANEVVEAVPVRPSGNVNHLLTTSAGNTRAGAVGPWLLVQGLGEAAGSRGAKLGRGDVDAGIYLGYEPINVMTAGLDADASHVTWQLGDRVVVEAVGTGEIHEVPGTRGRAAQFVDFVDPDTLVLTEWNGKVELLRWADGASVGGADINNNIQQAEFAGDGRGSGVLVLRTNLWQNPTLVEVDDARLSSVLMMPGATSVAGPWLPAATLAEQGFQADWGVWSLDDRSRFSLATAAELRGANVAKVEPDSQVPLGPYEHIRADGVERVWWVRTTGNRPTLYRAEIDALMKLEDASKLEDLVTKHELGVGFVVQLRPSPDGGLLAVVQQRDPGAVITVLDVADMRTLWALPIPSALNLDWADNGGSVVIASGAAGGAVFDSRTGEIQSARCGMAFQALETPPVMMGSSGPFNVCGL